MAMSRTYYSVDGKIRGEHRQGETYSRDYLHDALGSVVAVFQNGNQVAEGVYKPYGFRDGEWQMDSYKFSWNGGWGYRRTGMGLASNYVRARHYAQFSGGWNTVDPLWPSEMPYGYALANPLLHNDPTGMACKMTRSDISVLIEDKPTCRARCEKNINPVSWACGMCIYELYTTLTVTVSMKGCKNCKIYQWVSHDGKPFRKDKAAGWPYPWTTCHLKGTSREYCIHTDQPNYTGAFYPCAKYFSADREFITCVCCDGFSACFKWGSYQSADGCIAFCDHWGPTWLDKKSTDHNCLVASK